MMLWCKHGFQRWRSNYDRKFVHFKGYGAQKLNREFLNKGWGLQGLNKLFKKLRVNLVYDDKTKRQRSSMNYMNRRQHWCSLASLVFIFCNIRTQTGHYKKGICFFGCRFTQLQYYQILLKLVNIWLSNHKNKKGELTFETLCRMSKKIFTLGI